jgi:hypothetical protein
VEAVKAFRLKSTTASTVQAAERASEFFTIVQPNKEYLAFSNVTTEKYKYIPMAFVSKDIIVSNACQVVEDAGLYEFGVLTSRIHMAWARRVTGRLGNGIQYSASLVYNTFPWPTPNAKQKKLIEKAAQAVLDARAAHPLSTLADLYDSITMPPDLTKAHQRLDKAVEDAYGRVFASDSERVAYLFELYQKLDGELFVDKKRRGKGRKK